MYKVIKPEIIYHFFENDHQMINEMLDLILQTNIHDLRNLLPYFEQKEFLQVKKRCHKSKPSMSYLGATSVRRTLETIEKDVENKFITNYPQLLDQLQELEEEMKTFLTYLHE